MRGVGAPHRGVPLRRDREVTALLDGCVGEVGGEVTGVRAGPQPICRPGRSTHGFGDPGQATAQHVGGAWPDVVVAGQQIRRGGQSGLGPGRQVRTARALPGVVVGHALLLRPVDLHVGGVQVQRHLRRQRHLPVRRQQAEPTIGQIGGPGLDPGQLLRAEPASKTRSGRGRQHRHRRQLDRGHVGTLPVQGDQRIGTEQLRLRQADQQFTGRRATRALLQQADPAVEPTNDIERIDELRDRRDARGRGQRRIRRADPHTLPDPTTTTYCFHRQGALPAGRSKASRTSILQPGRAPSSSHTRITPPLLADPGLKRLQQGGPLRRQFPNPMPAWTQPHESTPEVLPVDP